MGFDGPTGSRNSVTRPISLRLLSAEITQWAGENVSDDRRDGFPDEIIPAAPDARSYTSELPPGWRERMHGEARAHDK